MKRDRFTTQITVGDEVYVPSGRLCRVKSVRENGFLALKYATHGNTKVSHLEELELTLNERYCTKA